jgi:hypothetical protein
VTVQDAIAWVVVALAAGWLVRRLTGWPRRAPKGPPVQLGERLERGLKNRRKV